MGRFRDWIRGRPRHIQQAQPLPVHTPQPNLDEFGDTDGPPLSIFSLFEPSPDHVNYVFLHSDEWARTVVRIRNEVWRRGIEVVHTHPYFCAACGEPSEDETKPCEQCGAVGQMMPPNPTEKRILEEFLHVANLEKQSLQDVGERVLEENLKHGRGPIVFQFDYELEDDGRIRVMTLKEVRAADPGRVLKIKGKKGRVGGKFVCLACRSKPNYKAEPRAGPCRMAGCGGVTYEAWWVEYVSTHNQVASIYWLPDEVFEARWPYKDGSSPATRIWNKLVYLLWDDRYSAQANDPRTPQRPDKLFVTMGGDSDAVAAWAIRDAKERARNRYKMAHLHLPAPPGGLVEAKMDAKVLDLGDVQFRLKDLERRTKFEEAIRNHYHLSDLQGGGEQTAVGLGNDSMKLRSTAQVAEDIQKAQEPWLTKLAKFLGVFEWTYRFPPALEEDEGREADNIQKQLANARSATDLGLVAHWRNNRVVIPDGEVQKVSVSDPFGAPPVFGDGKRGPEKPEVDMEPDEAGDEVVRPKRAAQTMDADHQLLRQSLNRDDQLPQGVKIMLGGPSGAVEAKDALWFAYADLTLDQSQFIRDQIVDSLLQRQGWSIDSIAKRITPTLKAAGIENPEARAETIARTEVRSLASTFKLRKYQQDEEERGEPGSYRIRGAKDFRRTKLSWWIDAQVGAGKPLSEVLRIMDDGIALCKAGAFTADGALSGTMGQPIRLPAGFFRRGFLCHYSDRDEVVEVI